MRLAALAAGAVAWVGAAIASLCCLLPLTVIVLGVGSGAFMATTMQYRWLRVPAPDDRHRQWLRPCPGHKPHSRARLTCPARAGDPRGRGACWRGACRSEKVRAAALAHVDTGCRAKRRYRQTIACRDG